MASKIPDDPEDFVVIALKFSTKVFLHDLQELAHFNVA